MGEAAAHIAATLPVRALAPLSDVPSLQASEAPEAPDIREINLPGIPDILGSRTSFFPHTPPLPAFAKGGGSGQLGQPPPYYQLPREGGGPIIDPHVP